MWRDVSPTGAIADFITVFKQAGPNRWRFAALALLPPLGIVYMFMQEEVRGQPARPEITYITSWRADRSMDEIVRTNLENQRRKEREEAIMAQREANMRDMYKTLGRYSGMDVDAIEKRAEADRAAEAAKQKAEDAELRRRQAEVYGDNQKD